MVAGKVEGCRRILSRRACDVDVAKGTLWSPNPIVGSCGKRRSELEYNTQVVMLEVEEVLIRLLI